MGIHLNHNVMRTGLTQDTKIFLGKYPEDEAAQADKIQSTMLFDSDLEWTRVFERKSSGGNHHLSNCEYHWLVCFKKKMMMWGTE